MSKINIYGNWKTAVYDYKTAQKLFPATSSLGNKKISVQIALPFPFLGLGEKTKYKFGTQDVSVFSEGVHTGEVTAKMIKSTKASFVVVGHSERRKNGEKIETIKEKMLQVLKVGLTAIVCIGEDYRDGDGQFFHILQKEINFLFKDISKKFVKNIIIAYEPVWAISTEHNGSMEPHVLEETVIFIKKNLSDIFGKQAFSQIEVIYGGSVDHKNIKEFVLHGGVNGFLVGKSSQSFESLRKLVNSLV